MSTKKKNSKKAKSTPKQPAKDMPKKQEAAFSPAREVGVVTEKAAKSTDSAEKNVKEIKLVKPKFLKFLGITAIVLLTVLLVDYVVQYINNDYSIAVVNGSRVPRSEFEQRLEEAYGEVISTQLVNEALIEQEALDNDVTVSDEEVQKVIDETKEELGGEDELESALLANGLTLEVYKRNLRIQLMAEKLVVDEPSEDDLKKFFTDNQETYFDLETKYEDVQDEIKSIYVTQKFNEESALWLSNLQEGSDVVNNVTDKPSYGIFKITRDLINDLNNSASDTKEESDE